MLTPNFNLAEFASHDRGLITPVPAEHMANVTELARNLQRLRDKLGTAITVTSSYRTLAHNINVGGVGDSRHLTASAADFVVPGVLNADVYCAIEDLIREGRMRNGGLGYYGEGNNHIHYDTRPTPTRWPGQGVALPVCPPPQPEEEELLTREYDELKKAQDSERKRLNFLAGLVVGAYAAIKFLGALAKNHEERIKRIEHTE